MKLLLTNDDGIDAPGIVALRDAVAGRGTPTIAAPTLPFSAKSHCITTDRPISIEERETASFAIGGSPADCVRLGLHRLVPQADWVLAGINLGGNLGSDIHYSGTVAAVREATMHGYRGIAFSHYLKKGYQFNWPRAIQWVQSVLDDLLNQPLEAGQFWNVNLPCLEDGAPTPRIVHCPVDISPLPLSFRQEDEQHQYDGDYHSRKRKSGTDVDVCFSGDIAVSKIILYANAEDNTVTKTASESSVA